jgi:hypothetical protein
MAVREIKIRDSYFLINVESFIFHLLRSLPPTERGQQDGAFS